MSSKLRSVKLSAVLIFATSSFAIADISGTVFKDFNNDGVLGDGDSVSCSTYSCNL